MTAAPDPARFRWLVLAVFVLSSAINYLDRMTLAMLKPVICDEFRLSNTQYGWIVAGFSITYAATAPFAGIFIDRVGLNRAVSLAVGVWSCAGIATGFTSGLKGLLACRAVLGTAEAAGIPSAGKAIHLYLRPAERALGNAVNQAGVSLGWILAAPLATSIALRFGWRHAFIVTGVLGLAWIPLWNWAARQAPAAAISKSEDGRLREILTDPRLWAFVLANALSMIGYSLWSNWTTAYLVDVRHLTLVGAAWLAWIPPVFAAVGGFAGGWLSLRLIHRGVPAVWARYRVCLTAAVISLAVLVLPWLPTAAWACAGISLGIFAVAAFSVNMYTLPLDVFGGARAAFAVSILVASYGAVQFLISPAFGWVMDHYGYTPLILLSAFTPLAACAVLRSTGHAQ